MEHAHAADKPQSSPRQHYAGALADARRNRANSQTNTNEELTRLAKADAQWPGSSNAHNCLPLDPKSHPSVNQTAEEGHAPFCRLEYSRHDFRAQTKHVQTSPAARAARACPTCTRTMARQQRAQTPGRPRTAPRRASARAGPRACPLTGNTDAKSVYSFSLTLGV